MNGPTGVIRSDDDAVRSKHDISQGQIRVTNSGQILSVNGQAIDFDNIASTVVGQIIIRNEAGGIIRSDTRDGVRPGANGEVINAGLIEGYNGPDPDSTSSDAIDFQAYDGKVTNLAGGQIIGGRHGITGDGFIEVINEEGGEIIGQNGSGVNLDGSGRVINHGLISGRWDGSPNGDGDGVDIDDYGYVENYGRIEALGYAGVHKDGIRPNGSDGIAITGLDGVNTLINHEGAEIYSLLSAVWISNESYVENNGIIIGDDSAVNLSSYGGKKTTLVNNGEIIGGKHAVRFLGGSDGLFIIQAESKITGRVTDDGGYDIIRLEDGATFDTQTGFEELQVTGSGTRLIGDNDFEVAIIEAGADLQLGNEDGSAGWAGNNIDNAGTLTLGLARDLSIDGMISGSGTVRFAGSGTVRYGGNDFAGTIETTGQPLDILAGTPATIRALGGAAVHVTGEIGGLEAAEGSEIVSAQPDLNVAGDLQLASGTSLELPVVDGTPGQIVVGGHASIDNAELRLTGTMPDLEELQRHVLLTAADGVTGTFTTSMFTGSNFVGALRNFGDRIEMLLRPANIQFRATAETANQIATADALQSLAAGNALRESVFWLLDPAESRQAYDALSGEIHASTGSIALETQAEIGRMMLDTNGESLGDGEGFVARGRAFGSWGRMQGTDAGRVNVDRAGFLLGLDRATPDYAVGLAGGYVRGTGKARQFGNARVNTGFVGAHGLLRSGPFQAAAAVTYSWHRMKTERDIVFPGENGNARSRATGHGIQGDFDLSWGIEGLGHGLELRPFAGLSLLHMKGRPFTETSAVAPLQVSSEKRDLQLLRLGARLTGNPGAMGLAPRLTAAWQRAFGDRNGAARLGFADSDQFRLAGVGFGRDQLLVDAGLDYRQPRWQLGLSYVGANGSGNRSHGVRGDIGVRF